MTDTSAMTKDSFLLKVQNDVESLDHFRIHGKGRSPDGKLFDSNAKSKERENSKS